MKTLLAALAALFLCGPALAQNNCGPRDAVIERLKEVYGESRSVAALSRDGSLVEFFGNLESGSWSITVSHPTGRTCIVAVGDGFETFDPIPAGEAM